MRLIRKLPGEKQYIKANGWGKGRGDLQDVETRRIFIKGEERRRLPERQAEKEKEEELKRGKEYLWRTTSFIHSFLCLSSCQLSRFNLDGLASWGKWRLGSGICIGSFNGINQEMKRFIILWKIYFRSNFDVIHSKCSYFHEGERWTTPQSFLSPIISRSKTSQDSWRGMNIILNAKRKYKLPFLSRFQERQLWN